MAIGKKKIIADFFLPPPDFYLPRFGINKKSLFFKFLSILEKFKFHSTFIKVVSFDPLLDGNFKYLKSSQVFMVGQNIDF